MIKKCYQNNYFERQRYILSIAHVNIETIKLDEKYDFNSLIVKFNQF